MSNTLSDLGRDLASTYHEQIAGWSALESGFPAASLNASFALDRDILSLEESWQTFAALNQVLCMDFVPEDLLVVFGSTSEPQDELSVICRPVKPENDSLAAALRSRLFDALPVDDEGQTEHLPADELAGRQLSGDNGDTPALIGSPSFPTIGEDPSFQSSEGQVQPGAEFSTPGHSGAFDSQLSPLNRIRNQIGLKPEVLPTPTSIETEATKADSFWRHPLHNLYDFASFIHHNTDEQSEAARRQHPARTASQAIGPVMTGPAWMTPGETEKSKTGIITEVQEQTAVPEPVFETPPASSRPELLSFAVNTSGLPTQDQVFQSPLPQPTPSTDTDELLEALTERILRDFRRYYS